MKKLLLFFLFVVIACHNPSKQEAVIKQEVDYVNTIIGTPFAGFAKGLEGGGTLPCVGRPYAMTNFLPQTGENKMGRTAYVYEDTAIIGFLASHQPTVWMGDYGYVSMMPQIGDLRVLPKERALSFDHINEITKPFYYSVLLNAGNGQTIKAEIAAASRAAIFRFNFPAAEKAHIIIQGINLNPALQDESNDYSGRLKKLKGYVKIDTEKNEITGYNPDRMSAQLGPELPHFKGYFIIQSDKNIESYGTWDGDSIKPLSREQYGTRMGAFINFKTREGEKVRLRVASSFISIEQARENLSKEIPDWDFEKLVNSTREIWQQNLSRIKIDGVSEDQRSIFYTAMFHTMQFPREFCEYGQYYSAFDDKIHAGISYTDYSLWDTYRALHPLLLFTQPERVNDMITAMLQMYKEGGRLPMWPNPAETNIMISTHADAVIADAYVKGFRGFDANLAYEALRKDATVPPDNDTILPYADRDKWTGFEVRAGLTSFNTLGYVPYGKTSESVSRTIEYSADNYSVAQLAKALAKTDEYNQILAWSKNYKNLYDEKSGFLLPRNADGSFKHFNPKDKLGRQDGFTEGDQWTYAFGAMHDPPGMIEMMGGDEKFAAKLDENFAGGHYRHDNEPGHHYIYLYDYCHQPWKTQELVRKHISENFRNKPLGINGNEDCGQMAAWYIFGVMGFYPVAPASGMYAIGAPQFPKLVLHYKAGGIAKTLTIIANNLSDQNKYIQKLTLDGKPVDKPFLSHQQILNGNELMFEMGSQPNKAWK